MKTKFIISILLLMSLLECERKIIEGCPMCSDPALEITMMDSNGNKMNGFNIKAITTSAETLFASDSMRLFHDSTYWIWGKSGKYRIEISSLRYETIIIDSVNVSGGKCGPNARILGIIAKQPKLAKKLNVPYIIAFDSSGVGCGN